MPTGHALHARVGDWLVTGGRGGSRRGEIIEVEHPDGSPPYRVRWVEDDHEGIVFPGPEAIVVPAADLRRQDADERDRLRRVQDAIQSESAQP